MSAIAGVWFFDGKPDALQACERMQQALLPYGPDRLGVWSGGDIALASCLMRLLPEDRFDTQPISVRGGRLIVVADARLDNRDELFHALDISPGDGAQLSDSDILAKALERWGEAALSRLVGDFAFAAWDVDTRSLLIARDHMDARPLHYYIGNGWFAFASMPKGLLALEGVSAAPNIERLCVWQLIWTKEPGSTFYESIQCVEPGHLVRINSSGVVTAHRHWQPECLPRLRFLRFDDYGDALRELLDRSTAARLRATGGISMLLSGGLDSTAVAASAATQLGHDRGPLHAFTSVPIAGTPPGYGEHVFIDEGPLAALMAERYPNIKHHLVSSEGCDLLAEMQTSIAWADQPVLNPTNTVWMNKAYGLSQQAGCIAVLTGGKGNLGLSYNGEHVLPELFGQLRWLRLFSEAFGLVRSGRAKRVRGLLRQAVEPWLPGSLQRLLGNAKQFESSINSMFLLITPHIEEWLSSRDATIHLQSAHIKHHCYRDWLVSYSRGVDSGNANAAINAVYGVDRRDPTADRRLLEFCMRIPSEVFLRNGQRKALYFKAFGSRVPSEILNERRRGLQAADWKALMSSAHKGIIKEFEQQRQDELAGSVMDVQSLISLAHQLQCAQENNYKTYRNLHHKLSRGLSAGLFLRSMHPKQTSHPAQNNTPYYSLRASL